MRALRPALLIGCWFLVVPTIAVPLSALAGQGDVPETHARDIWIDPSTGLTWAAKDNGRNVGWNRAMKYCRDLRLAGYSDWRLANMRDLQGIYDQNANAPGRAGQGASTWHVKGNLFLTGIQWSSNYRTDEHGRAVGYSYYFDFNDGTPDNDENTYSSFKRALCVRGSRPDGAP